MSMDTRLFISSIPKLQGERLCEFLIQMDAKEKAHQEEEQTAINEAKQKREPNYNRAGLLTLVGLSSLCAVAFRVFLEALQDTSWNPKFSTSKQGTLIGFAVEKSSNYKFSTALKALGCVVFAVAYVGACLYHKKADAIQVPNFDDARGARLQKKIRKINAELKNEGHYQFNGDIKQMLHALDALNARAIAFKA